MFEISILRETMDMFMFLFILFDSMSFGLNNWYEDLAK